LLLLLLLLLPATLSETPKVPAEQLPQYLAALPGWQLAQDHASISRQFVAKNFVAGGLRGQASLSNSSSSCCSFRRR
jgi:hypothetical protein